MDVISVSASREELLDKERSVRGLEINYFCLVGLGKQLARDLVES